MEKKQDISIVIPVFNEEGNLSELYSSIISVMLEYGYEYEIIFVDDGSSDSSFYILQDIAAINSKVKLISFRRNFGQTAAISAGIKYADKDIVVCIDADLQNDPADIPKLIDKINEGYDLVSGWRKNRQDSFSKRIPSLIANKLISKSIGIEIHDNGCSLKAYRKEILDEMNIRGEMHRYMPILASSIGAKITEVQVMHHPRKSGKSKYGIGRTPKVIIDLLTIKLLGLYGTKPNYIYGGVSIIFGCCGILSLLEVILTKLICNTDMTGNPFLLLTVLFVLLSIITFLMGLQADVLAKIYLENNNNKQYSIKYKKNIDE